MSATKRNVLPSVAGLLCAALLLLAGPSQSAGISAECGDPFDNDYGPFDYTSALNRTKYIPTVEKYHFTQDVEQLRGGAASEDLLNDLDHVLRVSPNHHRALYSVSRYLVKIRGKRRMDGKRSPHCYFDRAMYFSPADGTVRMIYGMYLANIGEFEASLQRYGEAYALMPDSLELNYNLGLLHLKMKNYQQANHYAQRAYQMGMPLPGLRDQLVSAGAWNPVAETITAP